MAEKKKRGRPATGQTRTRGIRIPDARWQAVEEIAERDDKSASAVVNEAIEEHIKRDARKHGGR
jgi:predicted transcriptional regulator